MRIYCPLFLIMSMGLISSVSAQKETVKSGTAIDLTVPSELLEFVDDYLKDTTFDDGFSFNNCKVVKYIDSSYQLSDLKPGIPIRQFHVDFQKMLDHDGNLSISAAAEPVDYWYVPLLLVNGKTLYLLVLTRKSPDEKYTIPTIAFGKDWDEKRVAWPENSGYTPVFVRCGNRNFLHFPEIDDYNLMNFYERYGSNDPVANAFEEVPGEENSTYISSEVKGKKFINKPLPQGAYLADCRKIFKKIVDEHNEAFRLMEEFNKNSERLKENYFKNKKIDKK